MASSKKYIIFAGLIGLLSLFAQPVWAEEKEVLNCKSVREYSTFTNEFTIFKYEDQIVRPVIASYLPLGEASA